MIITMTRAEGPTHECGQPKTARSFEEANRHLVHWSHSAPKGGGYDKVDFKIIDEESGVAYAGRYDLKHWHTESANLFAHVIGHLEFVVGDAQPLNMTTERYNAYLANDVPPGHRDQARDLIKFFKDRK